MNNQILIDELSLRIRDHYSLFLDGLGKDILMTAHSHQSWPNVSRDGHMQAWDDAAKYIDGKWDKVFSSVLPAFQEHVAKRIGSSRPQGIAIAPNTHELGYRLLSCFKHPPAILTTGSEFHSLRRQLNRLAEDGAQITNIETQGEDFCERFCSAIREGDYDLVALSYVFFTNAEIVTQLPVILSCAAERGFPVFVDLYHAFNTLELNVDSWPGQVFAVGGGYKYAQSGEGVCWMLIPEDASTFRPRNTGWFADFVHLEKQTTQIEYGDGGQRFLGATFDPTSLYRANAVMDWMDEQGLTVQVLRQQAQRQTELIIETYEASELSKLGFKLASPRSSDRRASFVSLRHPNAMNICKELAKEGLRTDARRDLLRLGPAPYSTSDECMKAVEFIQRRAV